MSSKFTHFQNLVYEAVKKIPEGKVVSYTQVAEHIGKKKAERAVGRALANNPFIGQIPCHRVVKKDASLGGFVLGENKKMEMLKKEGVRIRDGKIFNFKEKVYYFNNFDKEK